MPSGKRLRENCWVLHPQGKFLQKDTDEMQLSQLRKLSLFINGKSSTQLLLHSWGKQTSAYWGNAQTLYSLYNSN